MTSGYRGSYFASTQVQATFLAMIGMTSGRTNKLWRSRLVNGVSELLRIPRIHAKFATSQGDAAMAGLGALLKLHHDPHPWADLWREIAVEHPLRDEWWEERSMIPFFDRIQGRRWQQASCPRPQSLDCLRCGRDHGEVRRRNSPRARGGPDDRSD